MGVILTIIEEIESDFHNHDQAEFLTLIDRIVAEGAENTVKCSEKTNQPTRDLGGPRVFLFFSISNNLINLSSHDEVIF
jgi:hypothetical protein